MLTVHDEVTVVVVNKLHVLNQSLEQSVQFKISAGMVFIGL